MSDQQNHILKKVAEKQLECLLAVERQPLCMKAGAIEKKYGALRMASHGSGS